MVPPTGTQTEQGNLSQKRCDLKNVGFFLGGTTYIYIYMYVYVYVYIYICMYIYIYICNDLFIDYLPLENGDFPSI